MTRRSLSWIDPARWAELLERARLDPAEDAPDEGPATGEARPVEGPDPTRLDALLERSLSEPGVEGAFVCDPAGSALVASRVETLELSLAPALMGLLAHQRKSCGGPERGMLMVAFGGRRRLHLMETLSRQGRYALGVVADRTLPDTVLLQLQLELGRVVRGEVGAPGPSDAGPERR